MKRNLHPASETMRQRGNAVRHISTAIATRFALVLFLSMATFAASATTYSTGSATGGTHFATLEDLRIAVGTLQDGDIVILGGDDNSLTANLTGTGTVTFEGAGTIIGNLGIVNNGTFKINCSDVITLTGNISGAGNVVKSGAGSLVLGGMGSTFSVLDITGGSVVGDFTGSLFALGGVPSLFGMGVIRVDGDNSILEVRGSTPFNRLDLIDGADIRFSNNAVFRHTNATLGLIGGTIDLGGTGRFDFAGNVILGSTAILNASATSLNFAGNVAFDYYDTGIASNAAHTLNFTGTGTQFLSRTTVGVVSVKATLVKTGAGTLLLNVSITDLLLSSALRLDAGTLAFSSDDQFFGGIVFSGSAASVNLNGYNQSGIGNIAIGNNAIGNFNFGGDNATSTEIYLGNVTFGNAASLLYIHGYTDAALGSAAPDIVRAVAVAVPAQVWFYGYNKGATFTRGELSPSGGLLSGSIWNGDAGDNLWSTPGNWVGGNVSDIPNSTGAIANFDAVSTPSLINRTILLDANHTIGTLNVTGPASAAPASFLAFDGAAAQELIFSNSGAINISGDIELRLAIAVRPTGNLTIQTPDHPLTLMVGNLDISTPMIQTSGAVSITGGIDVKPTGSFSIGSQNITLIEATGGITGITVPQSVTVNGIPCSIELEGTTTLVLKKLSPNIDPTTVLPNGTYGTAYTPTTFSATSATPVTWSAILPAGLAIDPNTGEISGTPTVAVNSFNASVTATNTAGTDSKDFTITINKKESTASGVTATKTYDGTVNFTESQIDISGATLNGNIDGTNLTLSKTDVTGALTSANAGTGGNLTLGGSPFTLSGSASNNYNLSTQPTVSANISKATLTIDLSAAVVLPKIYDGTTTATVTGVELVGEVASENLLHPTDFTWTADFDDANAGATKTVTVTVTLVSNALTDNYQLPTATADIINQSIELQTGIADVETRHATSLHAVSINGGLQILGLVPGEVFRIYTLQGKLIYQGKAIAEEQFVRIPAAGMYLVLAGERRIKAIR